jgi:hypothetical protein
MSELSVTRHWRCYVCGATDIRKYNAVQHDGRYICIENHLLHEDALARIAELEAELAAFKDGAVSHETLIATECERDDSRAELVALRARHENAEVCGSCWHYDSFGSALYCTVEGPERIHAYDHERDFRSPCQYEPPRWAAREDPE